MTKVANRSRTRRTIDPSDAESSPSWVGVIATLAFPVGTYLLFKNLELASVVALASAWFAASYGTGVPAEWRFSACRLYLPIFVGYNFLSLFATGLHNRSLIFLLIVLSTLGFFTGWAIRAPRKRLLSGRLRVRRQMQDPNGGIFKYSGVIWVVALTVLLYLVLWVRSGVLPAFSSDPNLARTKFYPSGYVATLVVMGVHMMSFVGMVWLFSDKPRRVLGLALWVLAVLMGLGTGNRGIVFIPIVLAVLYIGYRKRLNIARLMPGVLLGILCFAFIGYSRSRQTNGAAEYSSYLESLGYSGNAQLVAPIMKYVYSTAQTFDQSIDFFPKSVPYALGEQFFSPLLLHVSVDLYLKDVLGGTFEGFGLALGSMNALYIDWGVVGVVLGAVVFGLLAATLFAKALASGAPRWIAMYCYFLLLLLLSNYGHPFAYIYYIIEPVILFFLIKPASDLGANFEDFDCVGGRISP